MQDEGRIFRNAALLTLGHGIGDLCVFLFLIFFARAYGPDSLGAYSFAMAVGAMLAAPVSFGLNAPLKRDISRQPELGSLYVGNVLLIELTFAVCVLLLLGGMATLMDLDFQSRIILLLIGTYHIASRLSLPIQAQFSAHEQMQYPAMLEAGHKVLILLVATTVVYLGGGPLSALVIYPLSAVLMVLMGLVLAAHSFGRPVLKPDVRLITQRLRIALPFFGIIMVAELYVRSGIVILNAFHGRDAVGTYAAAERLTVFMGMSYIMFAAAVMPVMCRLGSDSTARLRELYIRCQRVVIVVTLPAATLIFLLREQIIALLFGEEYGMSSAVLGVLALGLVLKGLGQLQFGLSVACNRQGSLFANQLVVLVLFLAAALLIVPIWRDLGLAGCVVGCNFVLVLMNYVRAERAIVRVPFARLVRGPASACLGASIVFYLLDGLSIGSQLTLTLLTGAVGMWLFKAVEAHDFVYLRKVILGT